MSEPTQDELKKEVALQELEIAKLHGDVAAALKLDRIARGEEEVQTEPEPEPTPDPEPEPTPAPATGASARRALSSSG